MTPESQLPPLTQAVGGMPSTPVVPAHLAKPKVARQIVERIRGTKDTTSKVLAALNKRAGRTGAVSSYTRSSESVATAVKYVIRTGIDSFDDETGGFPFSKVVELYGLESCGKTSLAMLACGAAAQGNIYEVQQDGSTKKLDVPFEVSILYLDNENSLDEGDRLMVYDQEVDCVAGECDTIDQIFKDIETASSVIASVQAADEEKAKKEKKEGREFVAPLQFLVVVVDTVAGTSTRAELGQDWAKQDYKRQPGELRDGFRNTIRRLKEQNVCAIFTNQVSDSFKPKPKGMANKSMLPQESDFTSFGGKAIKYYANLRVFLCRTNFPYKLAPGPFADGFQIHFFVSKNRFRMPLRSGRMVLLFKNALCQSPQEWAEVVRPARIAEMVEREKAKGNKKFTDEDASRLFPQYPPGGFSPIWSRLEHLVYLKFVVPTATKGYRINFAKYGICGAAPAPVADLQEADAQPESAKDEYELSSKLEWPAFYAKHKAEVDQLFAKAIAKSFAQNGVDIAAEADDMELDPDLVPQDDLDRI